MKLYDYVFNTPITEDFQIGEKGNFNIKTLELNYKGEFRKLLNCPNRERDGNALDQIVMTGHYLYSVNEQFRDAYLSTTKNVDWTITDNDLQRFVLKDYFNLFLYGFVVDKYVQSMPEKPLFYLTRSVDNVVNKDLSNYSRKYTEETKKPFFYKKGCPFYCYYVDDSKVIKRKVPTMNYTGNNNWSATSIYPDIVICPISNLIPRMKELSSQIHSLAEIVYSEFDNTINSELHSTFQAFVDPSWNQFLEIKRYV